MVGGSVQGYGAKVIEQDFQPITYTGTVLKAANIICPIQPGRTRRIVLK